MDKYGPNVYQFFKKVFPHLQNEGIYLLLRESVIDDFDDVGKNIDGISSPTFDSFIRMLYLSLITITTVGYGDILPISTLARMLVGAEAITGLILLGILVNRITAGNRVKKETVND